MAAPVAFLEMKIRSRRKIKVTFTPETGTLTLVSATVCLYDSQGAIAGSVSDVAVTGFDTGAQSASRAWYRLSPTVLGLTLGTYTLTFLAIDSDGEYYEESVSVVVIDNP